MLSNNNKTPIKKRATRNTPNAPKKKPSITRGCIPKGIMVDFKNIRVIRQKNNNISVFNSIKNDNKNEFIENTNEKELKRTLDELSFSFEELWDKCRKDSDFAKLASGRLSKRASRQGSKDEEEQLRTCNFTTNLYGVKITNLSATAIRPTKNGHIVTKKEMKQQHITKDCCLKSFDGKLSGKVNGYIAAKVSFGNGGHQDNVFEEMDSIANWWSSYKEQSKEYLIILIDTDLIEKFICLRKKYEDYENIKVFNHYEFQNYIINLFYKERK